MISVIVPVYNAEKWLQICIDSVLSQNNIELELVLVDDGSTDNSSNICKEYEAKDSRVKYLKKNNEGVSAARNYGIEHSCGEWITFLDSDDYLSSGILGQALDAAQNDQNRMVIWNAAYIVNDVRTESSDLFDAGIVKEDIISAIIFESFGDFFLGYFFRAVWGKLFRREFIEDHQIKFDTSLYIGEDAKFLLQYFSYIDGVTIINNCGYNYRIQEQSAVHRYKEDLLYQSRRQLEEIEKITVEYPDSITVNTSKLSFLWGTFNALVNNEALGNNGSHKFKEAYTWYNENREGFEEKKICPNRMSKFLRLEMYCNKILPISVIARFSLLYGKNKYRR